MIGTPKETKKWGRVGEEKVRRPEYPDLNRREELVDS
jgi:hypothetical protein